MLFFSLLFEKKTSKTACEYRGKIRNKYKSNEFISCTVQAAQFFENFLLVSESHGRSLVFVSAVLRIKSEKLCLFRVE